MVKSFELELPLGDRIIGDNFDEKKHVFVLALQEGSIMEDKVRRLCQSFSQYCYDVHPDSLDQDLVQNQELKSQTKEVIRHTKHNFLEYLEMVNKRRDADASVFKLYKVYILREKAIYTHLNMLKQHNMVF